MKKMKNIINVTIFIFIQVRKLYSQVFLMVFDIIDELIQTNNSIIVLIRTFDEFLQLKKEKILMNESVNWTLADVGQKEVY
jgi:hypothetical protein